MLRFELELALIEGDLDVADLPAAWNDGMRRLLGVEVPDDAAGVLQDTHWAAGAFGYFPSYALGCLIAAQLWEALERDLGPQDEPLGRGDVTAIRAWLAEHVHRLRPAAGHRAAGRAGHGPRDGGGAVPAPRPLAGGRSVAPANVNGGWVGRRGSHPQRLPRTLERRACSSSVYA